jgi:O-antigen/teichoic acid export membrane protein
MLSDATEGHIAGVSDRVALRSRVLSAGVWNLGGYGLSITIRFATSLIMSRLLVPDMFGLMTMAMVIMFGLAMFSDVGLGPSIIRSKRGDDPAFLNTAWSIQILRGFSLCAIALLVSFGVLAAQQFQKASIGSVYADVRLPYVIGAISLTLLIAGFNSTKLFEARRNLQLRRLTLIEIISQLVGISSTVTWAIFIDRSVWALVVGSICATLATTMQSHLWLSGTPNHLKWDATAVREILVFGLWIFASSILGFLVGSSDRLLLGGLIDAKLLGVYSIAVNIYSVFDLILSRVIGDVAYPALSEVARERRNELKAAYYRVHHAIASVAYLSAGVLVASGPSLIAWLYDPRYAAAGWMIQILAFGLLAAPSFIAVQCFLAIGRPNLHSVMLCVRLVVLFLAMPLGFSNFGLPGALFGWVLSVLVVLPVVIVLRVQHGLFSLRSELLTPAVFFVGLILGRILASAIAYLPKI